MIKVLVCGSRFWWKRSPIEKRLAKLDTNVLVIHGGAHGADSIAGKAANDLGIHVAEIKALWDAYGMNAGPIRNLVMLGLKPVLVIAFHQDIEKSKGTGHTVRTAREMNIPVEVIKE